MRYGKFCLVAVSVALLQGCVAAAVVGVVGGASVVNDRRSVGNQIDDQTIELNAYAKLSEQQALQDNVRLQVVSMNGVMLIVGQVPTTHLRDLAIKTLSNIDGVVQYHNQLRLGNKTSLMTQGNDFWLTSKVKTALFGSDHLDATNIKVVTENGEVFLMGLVSKSEADAAVEVARNISGVNRVFKAFEYQ